MSYLIRAQGTMRNLATKKARLGARCSRTCLGSSEAEHSAAMFTRRSCCEAWFTDKMVAHFTMRTYGVNHVLGIWLHRKSRQIRFFLGKDLFYLIRA